MRLVIRATCVIAGLAICGVIGCGSSSSDPTKQIVGIWEPPDQSGEHIRFNEGGTWNSIAVNDKGPISGGTWRITGDKLSFTHTKVKGLPAAVNETTEYRIESINEKLMYLTMPTGGVGEWKRVK